jgi:Icc-related predicted phosphoesterase
LEILLASRWASVGFRYPPGGSHSLKAFLEVNRVALCLCGHIHEAAGIERFQATLVANAGSFKKGHYLSVEIGPHLVVTPGRVDH